MQVKHEVEVTENFFQVLKSVPLWLEPWSVDLLIEKKAVLTTELLEQALATNEYNIISSAIKYAKVINLKASLKCLNLILDNRDQVTQIECSRARYIDRHYPMYRFYARSVKEFVEGGITVTREIVKKAIKDEQSVGNDIIQYVLDQGEESISKILLDEFKRTAEIRKISRVLAQTHRTRTSFFSTLPPELLSKIASKTGTHENNMSDHETDIEIATNSFSKPS